VKSGLLKITILQLISGLLLWGCGNSDFNSNWVTPNADTEYEQTQDEAEDQDPHNEHWTSLNIFENDNKVIYTKSDESTETITVTCSDEVASVCRQAGDDSEEQCKKTDVGCEDNEVDFVTLSFTIAEELDGTYTADGNIDIESIASINGSDANFQFIDLPLSLSETSCLLDSSITIEDTVLTVTTENFSGTAVQVPFTMMLEMENNEQVAFCTVALDIESPDIHVEFEMQIDRTGGAGERIALIKNEQWESDSFSLSIIEDSMSMSNKDPYANGTIKVPAASSPTDSAMTINFYSAKIQSAENELTLDVTGGYKIKTYDSDGNTIDSDITKLGIVLQKITTSEGDTYQAVAVIDDVEEEVSAILIRTGGTGHFL